MTQSTELENEITGTDNQLFRPQKTERIVITNNYSVRDVNTLTPSHHRTISLTKILKKLKMQVLS